MSIATAAADTGRKKEKKKCCRPAFGLGFVVGVVAGAGDAVVEAEDAADRSENGGGNAVEAGRKRRTRVVIHCLPKVAAAGTMRKMTA